MEWFRKLKTWQKIALIIVVLSIIGRFTPKTTSTVTAEPPKIETKQEKIEKLFSKWDGSLPALEKTIKSGMNDPDSYKHDETRFSDMKTHLVVITKFRGKNKFGGVVRNYVKAKVDYEGNIIEILEQE